MNDHTHAPQTKRWLGVVSILISAMAFGTLAIFARLAYAAGADPITVLSLRFAIAGAAMLGVMLARRIPFPRGKVLLGLTLMGALGYVGQSFAYFTALTYASAGLVALLLYLYPALVTLLSALFLKERLTRTKGAALALALVGTALTIGPVGAGHPLGVALGVAAAVIYAVYIIVGSRVTPQAGAIASSTVIMVAAALVYAGIAWARHPVFPHATGGWLAIVAIALIATVLAIVTFFAGMELIGPSAASMLSTIEPVVTVSLAAWLLGESLAPLQLVGGALILGAVLVLVRGQAAAPPQD